MTFVHTYVVSENRIRTRNHDILWVAAQTRLLTQQRIERTPVGAGH